MEQMDHPESMRDIVIEIRDEVTGLRENFDGLSENVGGLRENVDGVNNKVTNLSGQVTGLREDMVEGFQQVDGRLDKVDQELRQIKTVVGAINVETSTLIDTVADMNKRGNN